LSVADFKLFLAEKFVQNNDKEFNTKYPNLAAHVTAFSEIPSIKSYYSGEAQPFFPGKFAVNVSI